MKKILILLLTSFILFSGCSNSLSVNDGVIRTEQGESILGVYDDLPMMSHLEKAVFEGRAYIFSGHFSAPTNIPIYFLGCSKDKDIHFTTFNLELEGTPFDVHFYESPIITLNGTLTTPRNLNRNFLDNSSMDLYANPTIISNGTQLFHTTDYRKSNVPGETVFVGEMILKKNTCYLFEVLNGGSSAAEVTANFIYHQSR